MKNLQKTIDNEYEVYYCEREGYSIHSLKSDLDYDLVELKSFKGTTTTDMIAIMPSIKDYGYVGMLTYFFGADDEAVNTTVEIIEDFEFGKIKMQSYLDMDSLNKLLAHLLEKHITIRID